MTLNDIVNECECGINGNVAECWCGMNVNVARMWDVGVAQM